MVPAQSLMEIEADCKPQIHVELVADKEIKILVENSDNKVLACQDSITGIQAKNKDPQDLNVDVTECRNSADIRSVETDDPNATEYSSSFGNTIDDAENISGFSEGEVESQYIGDNGFGSAFDGFDNVFRMRKKKLTTHWRNYIRPVMWRCKWMELRMKNIDTQVSKYSRELNAYDRGKQLEFEEFNTEEICSKASPLKRKLNRNKAMKRRRRKRVEDTVDVATYMSQHNFFSYLESKRSDPDNASLGDEFCNAATELSPDCEEKLGGDDWTELGDGDVSMEQVLFKIESVHSWVARLKDQVETVISKNAPKFSSSENLSLLAPHSPAFSAGNGDAMSPGDMYASAQHLTDFDIGDLVLPESYGEAVNIPDVIESTVGLLSAAADVTLDHPQFGDSNEDLVEDTVMHEATTDLMPVKEEEEDVKPVVVAAVPPQQQPCLNFPPNKKKRGERKAASVWNKPCSLDSDSQ